VAQGVGPEFKPQHQKKKKKKKIVSLLLFSRLEFELRVSHLQSRHSTVWATPLVHFALVVLKMGVSQTICLAWASKHNPPTLALARIKGTSHQSLAAVLF
jgi:hypothetical protein